MFECDMCGKCCKNLNLSEVYSDLDRGDGVCKYLKDNLCSIYDKRPLKCRVDECYNLYFSELMTLEEYYKENKKVCNELNKKEV